MEIGNMAGRAGGALPVKSATTLVSNGAVDIRGRIADKVTTGGWRAAPFVIVNEVVERMAFSAIGLNMVIFLKNEMHEVLPEAISHVTNWIGAAFVLTILGAFVADAYLGRFLTILIFSSVYAVGIVLLTLAANIDSFRPPPCQMGSGGDDCRQATKGQNVFLYGGLSLIAIGTGGIKPCISSFGADQFDESDSDEARKKYSFFNWFFFAINLGFLLGITVVAYVIDRKGWGWGFGMSAVATLASVAALLSGTLFFRHQRPRGSPFTRFLQVLVAACCNQLNGTKIDSKEQLFEVTTKESAIHGARKLGHTNQFRFLDKAAVKTVAGDGSEVSRWRLCTVTQVEEFKSFLRVIPIWATTFTFPLAFAQLNFFVSQAIIMDRHLGGNFVVPPGSVVIFTSVNALIFIPIYERYGVKIFKPFTGHPRGLTSLQRIGIGLAILVPTFAIAAAIEQHRRSSEPSKLTFWWLFPQYFLLGICEVFVYVGQLEFFYDEATDGTRSLSSALFLSAIGVGYWLSSLVVKFVEKTTGGVEKGWLRKDLNESKLDYYYWLLCGINMVNLGVFMVAAWCYKGGNRGVERVDGEEMGEEGIRLRTMDVEEEGSRVELLKH